MKKLNLLIVIIALLASSVFAQAESSESSQDATAKNSYDLPEPLLPLWNSLTIEQKVAQMIMLLYYSSNDYLQSTTDYEYGGLLVGVFSSNKIKQYSTILQSLNNSLSINPIVATDQEGGLVSRIKLIAPQWENLPSAQKMSQMSESQVFSSAKEIGQVLSKLYINVNLAPVLDPTIDENGNSTFMNNQKRCWKKESVKQIRAFINGMKEHGIICASKHFPGYDSHENSDHQDAISPTSKKGISRNAQVFKELEKDIPITMMSSVRYTSISDKPAAFEPKIVAMARKMSPDVVILTDALLGKTILSWYLQEENPGKKIPIEKIYPLILKAIDAGNDMLMLSYLNNAEKIIDYLTDLCKRDPKFLHRIETSAARILKMKYNTGILKKDKLTPKEKKHHLRPKPKSEPKPWANYARP